MIDQASRFKALNEKNAEEEQSEDGDEQKESTLPVEKNFYIREQYVLAHSNNVDIILNDKFTGHNLLKDQKFFKMITKRQMPNMFEDILF